MTRWLGPALLALCCLAGAPAAAEEKAARRNPDQPNGESLTIDDKGITLTFPEDVAKLRIGGKMQLDFGVAGIRQAGFPEPFPENVAVRRAWIESYLTLGKTVELAFQYDFADPMRPINDAAAAYAGFARTLLTVGNMKEPFSLDQLASDNSTLFTERSLADAFAPARNFGFALGHHGEDWTVVASVFGGNANTGIGSEGVAGTARATYAVIHEPDRVLHLGLAGSVRDLPRDGQGLSLSSRSEAFLFQRNFVDTGDIRDASGVGRLGLEAAYRDGPVLIQAEYIRTRVERFGGAPAASFQGGYVQASIVLNGKGRAYKLAPDYGATYAIFSGVQVAEADRVSRGGIGVFELGTRFSAIDLDDAGIRGGIERDVTVGVNWYPDRNIRIMADYVRSHTGPSAIQGGRAIDADTFIGRFQLYW